MLYSIFKMECTVLIFLFKKQFLKEHSLPHTLILRNGINNIFCSQTSFLLLSSNTHTSFANKPINFCLCKPNTGQHIFAIIVCFAIIIFIYNSIFLLLAFFPNSDGCSLSNHNQGHMLL